MNPKLLSLSFLLFTVFRLWGQDPIIHSIYLIGDTGSDTIPSDALQLLAFEIFDDSSSSVVFLGDNCYPQGLNPHMSQKQLSIAQRKLVAQFELFSGYLGNVAIIPGNHDWSSGKTSGKRAVEAQAELTNAWFRMHSKVRNREQGVFSTPAGFPGPKLLQLDSNINLIALDSQWWLQRGLFKPVGRKPGMNRRQMRARALQQLDSMLAVTSLKGELTLVAAHHPLYSNGRHVHVNEPFRFLINYTPLQLFGLLGLNRYFSQDLTQPRYKRYRKSVESVLTKYPNAIYAAGHEHAMEYFKKDSLHSIVSGSGSKLSELDRYRYPAHFMDDLQHGFFRITFHASGSVILHAFGVKDRGEYWKMVLFTLSGAR